MSRTDDLVTNRLKHLVEYTTKLNSVKMDAINYNTLFKELKSTITQHYSITKSKQNRYVDDNIKYFKNVYNNLKKVLGAESDNLQTYHKELKRSKIIQGNKMKYTNEQVIKIINRVAQNRTNPNPHDLKVLDAFIKHDIKQFSTLQDAEDAQLNRHLAEHDRYDQYRHDSEIGLDDEGEVIDDQWAIDFLQTYFDTHDISVLIGNGNGIWEPQNSNDMKPAVNVSGSIDRHRFNIKGYCYYSDGSAPREVWDLSMVMGGVEQIDKDAYFDSFNEVVDMLYKLLNEI